MDSAENKKLIAHVFERVAQGDRKPYLDLLHDEVTMTVTGEYSWSRTFKGKESVIRDLYGYVASRAPGQRKTTPFRILADDDWVIVEARGDMTTIEGKPYRNHYCLLYRLAAGRIVEIREYQDSTLCERLLGPYPTERAL